MKPSEDQSYAEFKFICRQPKWELFIPIRNEELRELKEVVREDVDKEGDGESN